MSRARRPAPLALALAGLALTGLARADEPAPLAGWLADPSDTPPSSGPPALLELELDRAGIGRRARELAAADALDRLARLLAERARDPELRARWVIGGREGGALLGAHEEARRRLRALPPLASAGLRAEVERLLAELAAAEGPPDAAGLRELLVRFPGWAGAPEAARRLGELALEAGRPEDAAAWWREALSEAPPERARELERRLLALRARPRWNPTRPGALGGEAPRVAAPGLAWVRRVAGGRPGAPPQRAATADGERVYLATPTGVMALERRWGQIAWSEGLGELPAAPAPEQLLCWPAGLVALAPGGLRWLDPTRGALRGALAATDLLGVTPLGPDEGLLRAALGEEHLIVLGRADQRWVVAALDPDGRVVWRTRLWRSPRAGGSRALAPVYQPLDPEPCPFTRGGECPGPAGHPERARWRAQVLGGPWRPSTDDGALDCVGRRVLLTADGAVVALDALDGALTWARVRALGPLLGAGRTRVGLRAGAFGLEALTSLGAWLRLDPLDGAELATPSLSEPGRTYALCLEPLVLATVGAEGVTLLRGDGRALGPLGAQPLWPGAGWGPRVAVPTAAGVVWLDAADGRRLGEAAWPLGPGAVIAAHDLTLVVDEQGVAVFAPGAVAPPPLPETERAPADWIALLDHRDWRRRERARAELRAILRGPRAADAGTRLREAHDRAASLDLRAAAGELLAGLEALGRWQRIVPGAGATVHDRLAWGEGPRAAAELIPLLGEGPAVAEGLAAELRRRHDPAVQHALLELLLHADRAMVGWLVALVRNAEDPRVARAGADLLVAHARAGGSDRALRLLLKQRWDPSSPVIHALIASGDEALWTALQPPFARGTTLADLRQGLAFGGVQPASPDAAGLLRKALEHLGR